MRRIAAIAVVAAAVALSIPAIRYFSEEPPPLPSVLRLSLAPPDGTELGTGDDVLNAAISPNQQEVVFVARRLRRTGADDPPGSTQLWRRRLDAQVAEPLAGTEGASLPAWKHTGNVVSFFAATRLKLLNLRTGAVSEVGAAPAPAGAAWLRDGSLLFVPATGAIRRLLDGQISNATRLASGDVAHAFPVVAPPNGQDFTYVAVRADGRRLVRLRAGEGETDVGTTGTHAALLDRWLLFGRDDTLLVDYRDDEGRMGGHSLLLALDVGGSERGRGMFVASADVLLHAPAGEHRRQISWLDLDTGRAGTVGDVGDFWQIRVSPDDRSLAVTARDPLLGSLDVLNIPVDDQAAALRLTTSIAADSDPVWSPDGRRIAVRSMQRGRPEVLIMPAALHAAADRPDTAPAAGTAGDVPTDWRAGEMLVQRRGSAGSDLVRVQANGSKAVADSPFNETDGRWSPDGRWIAYVSDEPGQPDIYVHNEHGDRQRISQGGGTHPRWTRDSRALLFLRESTLMRAELGPGGARFGTPRRVGTVGGIRDFDLAHTQTDRVFALLAAQPERRETVSVILNWRSLAEAHRRRLASKTPPKF